MMNTKVSVLWAFVLGVAAASAQLAWHWISWQLPHVFFQYFQLLLIVSPALFVGIECGRGRTRYAVGAVFLVVFFVTWSALTAIPEYVRDIHMGIRYPWEVLLFVFQVKFGLGFLSLALAAGAATLFVRSGKR